MRLSGQSDIPPLTTGTIIYLAMFGVLLHSSEQSRVYILEKVTISIRWWLLKHGVLFVYTFTYEMRVVGVCCYRHVQAGVTDVSTAQHVISSEIGNPVETNSGDISVYLKGSKCP